MLTSRWWWWWWWHLHYHWQWQTTATPPSSLTAKNCGQERVGVREETWGRRRKLWSCATLTNSITVFVSLWEVGHRKKAPPVLFHPPPVLRHHNCGFAFNVSTPFPWYDFQPTSHFVCHENRMFYLSGLICFRLLQSSVTNFIII